MSEYAIATGVFALLGMLVGGLCVFIGILVGTGELRIKLGNAGVNGFCGIIDLFPCHKCEILRDHFHKCEMKIEK